MPSRKLGIVIVNWRSREVIIRCLESIRKAGYIRDVVVVDNGSDDGSLEQIRNQKPEIKIIENKKNLGFAEGNDEGIKYLLKKNVEYIFILNPDTEINSKTIPNLLSVMEEDKKIGIAGPKIYSYRGVLRHIWSCGGKIDKNRFSAGLIGLGEEDSGQYDKVREADFISGTAMMIRSEVFDTCGLFNPDYFVYYEDVELNLRVKKAGFKLVFVPNSIILHYESTSMGKDSPSQQYYMARNHMLFLKRNAPIYIRFREFVRLPKTILEYWRKKENWALKGLGDYFMKKFGKRKFY